MSDSKSTTDRFHVMIASDLDHERVYAEVYWDEKFVALVSQERGAGKEVLEFPGPGLKEDLICREVDLDGFLQAVELAVRKLAGE
jgi:hypothetical protein